MIPEQHLVQQIVEIIDSDQLERNPVIEEFAEQYADLCHDIVARLQRCAEYLDRGMRSEAVHEATSSPSLLELVEIVQFDQLRKWENVVTDLELAPFPRIPMDIVERLRQECTTEEDLSPLLKEYRRFVYQADQDGCIRVLRQLRAKDPVNPSWPENLKPLEEARLPALIERAEKALQEDDRPELRAIYEDMTHPQRLVPVPEDALARVRDALLAERRVEAGQRGAAIASRLHEAMNGGDEDRIEQLLKDWEELREDEAFRPTGAMENVVDDARTYHARRQREKENEAAFQETAAETRALLADPRASVSAIRGKLEELQNLDHPVPTTLQADIDETLDRLMRRRRRRARALSLAMILLALVIVGATGWGIMLRRNQARRDAQVREMTALLQKKEYSKLSAYLDRVRGQDPVLYDTADVRHLQTEVQKAFERQDELERQFKDVMSRLSLIRDDSYAASEEQIQRLLAEARQVAPDDAAHQAVDEWQVAWEQWRRRRRQQVNDELERTTTLMRRILDDRQVRPFATLADEAEALKRIEPLVEKGKPLTERAGTEKVNAYNAAVVDVQSWRRDFEQRRDAARQRAEKLEALRRQIPAVLPDLVQYRDLLKTFVETFPEEEETAAYRRVLNQIEACIKAEALRDFGLVRFPPSAEGRERLLQKATEEIVQGSVWEEDINTCVGYLRANARVRELIPRLVAGQTEMLQLHVLRYRPKDGGEWKLLYHPKPLMSREEEDEEGTYTIYWGRVYYYDDKETPYLIHTGKVFDDGLTTRDYDIDTGPGNQDNLVAHGRFLYRFVSEAVDADEMDIHILKGIQALLEDDSMNTIPRAWLLKRLSHFLESYYAGSVQEAVDMVRLADRMKTNVPWMNPDHPDVQAAADEIRDLLEDFPAPQPIIERLRANRAVLAGALSRQVRAVGSIRKQRTGSLAPVLSGPVPDRIWMLSGTTPGVRPSFKVAAIRGDDGSLVYRIGIEPELFHGQVVFAPGDGRTCHDVLEEAVPDGLMEEVDRPASWPVNAWVED